MSNMVTITSTMGRAKNYVVWEDAQGNMKRAVKSVYIAGGTGIANKKTLVVPEGVATQISEEDYNLLMERCPVFRRQMERGFLKVHKGKSPDTKGMEKKDDHAQATEKDFGGKKGGAKVAKDAK